mgnify:CR=1 FL=1
MATKRKLQIRYGAAASRPTLATGEWGLDTDTGSEAVYIGTPAGNKSLSTLALPSQTGNSGKFLTTNGTATSWSTLADTRILTLSFYKANPNDGDFLELAGISGVTDYTTRSTYTMARINGAFSGGAVFSSFLSISGLDANFTLSIKATVNGGGNANSNYLTLWVVDTGVIGTSTLTDAGAQSFAWCTVELY